ncbi:cobalt ECF transporter T component CbiQ [Thermosynechococcaceae cyanobacterium BACA0444]|uniref:Cobalt ECF transporter T component CbiQ n=1 Tax=Pseudocalidococcus azoricus BACA0444 TaxID=2918990 RepID=A0AAE4FQZ2_9CYAN|nr:cobalt ECF transporter T component CbiQ [Pseudocalidococcus azoricus]MDS3860643.1 cobalt ECF transporter T component CbiQ [Pseudocalidococcus azoricus BACA0444]
MLLHIHSVLPIQAAVNSTPWQTLTPPGRILCAGLGVFAIALTPNGQWLTWLVYGLAVLGLVILSQINLGELGKRLVVELLFLNVIILGTLFRSGGDVVWSYGLIRITSQGLVIMGSVAAKMLLSLILLNILTLTTSVSDLIHGLARLKVPPLLIGVLGAMYRYLGLLISEFQATHRAAQARNLMTTPGTIRLVISHSIGSLFIRTYERGERIYQAMAARGSGIAHNFAVSPYDPTDSRPDCYALMVTVLIAVAGQVSHYL